MLINESVFKEFKLIPEQPDSQVSWICLSMFLTFCQTPATCSHSLLLGFQNVRQLQVNSVGRDG